MWISNLIFALPIHLIVTGIVAGACWGLLTIFDVQPLLFGDHRPWRTRLLPIALVISCIAAVPLIAHGYAIFNDHRDAAEGSAQADSDWANHEPVIWSHDYSLYRECGESSLACYLDPDLNVPICQSWYRRFEPGYNAEIRRLLSHERPVWLTKYPRIADKNMIHMEHSDDMKAITAYPYTISANVVLIRGDSTLPWGGSISTGSNTALVETRYNSNGLSGILDASQPVWVGSPSQYPGVHFIRNGNTVIACSDDGWILETLIAQ